MDYKEWMRLIKDLKERQGIHRRHDIAIHLNQQLPDRSISTLDSPEWIGSFDRGVRKLDQAARGIEPQSSYLNLYINLLNPTSEERTRILEHLRQYNPNFDFTVPAPDYKI